MISKASTPEQYMKELPADRKEVMQKFRDVILKNLPKGFEEIMNYGMLSYVVPHTIYPAGYHCKPEDPLPFVSLASQKNFVAFYHMGLYDDPKLTQWFTEEYARQVPFKLDMGKSCVRFKKPEHIPYKLIGELMKKITVKEYVASVESVLNKNKVKTEVEVKFKAKKKSLNS